MILPNYTTQYLPGRLKQDIEQNYTQSMQLLFIKTEGIISNIFKLHVKLNLSNIFFLHLHKNKTRNL